MHEFTTEVESRYSIERELGRGAMGTVYLAKDLMLGEVVALKVLNQDLLSDNETTARFIREISLTRKVTHGNVVRTFEAGKWGSQVFFTMEFIDGVSLKDKYKDALPPLADAVEIFAEISKGLLAIHKADIIHRDLKLSNIMMSHDGYVKITDFGIARPKSSELTGTQSMLGTATHMAPEIWRGDEVTKQTDIYALGVIGYELFCGILPFPSQTSMELMFHHIHKNPPSPMELNPEIPFHIASLLLQMMQKDPKDRPGSVIDVLYQLEGKAEPASLFSTSEESPLITSSLSILEFSTPPATLEPTVIEKMEDAPTLAIKQSFGKQIFLKTLTLSFVIAFCIISFSALSDVIKLTKGFSAIDTAILFTASIGAMSIASTCGWGILFALLLQPLRALSLYASMTILNFLFGFLILIIHTVKSTDEGTLTSSYEGLRKAMWWQASTISIVPCDNKRFIVISCLYILGAFCILWKSLPTYVFKISFLLTSIVIFTTAYITNLPGEIGRISLAEKSFPLTQKEALIFVLSFVLIGVVFLLSNYSAKNKKLD